MEREAFPAPESPMPDSLDRIDTIPMPPPTALALFGRFRRPLRIFPVGWVGLVCVQPPLATLALPLGLEGETLRPGEPFSVNYLDGRQMEAIREDGVLAGDLRGGLTRAGLVLRRGSRVGVPLLVGGPLQLECTLLEIRRVSSQTYLVGEVDTLHRAEPPPGSRPGRDLWSALTGTRPPGSRRLDRGR